MLNSNLILNLVFFALFEFNFKSLTAEILDLSKQNNNSKLNLIADAKQFRSNDPTKNKHVLNFDWDLDTAAGHKKG